ncbi:MAG: glycosyltransferase family 9 protein [Sulfuriferula sp.]|nr:glycosyltransferase family 9 protein [Sulfuriferula sp.]
MSFDLPGDASIRRILIIKWSALGDIAMSTCVMEDVARAFPHARIDLNTLPPWDKLFIGDPRFTNISKINIRAKRGKWFAIWAWMQQVRRERYDLIVDLQSNDRSRFMLMFLQMTGNVTRYLIGNHASRPYNISGPTVSVDPNPVQRMRAALNAAGIPVNTPRPVLHIPDSNQRHARELQARYGLEAGRYAIFYPGCQAAGYLKRWGEDKYAELARQLLIDEVDHVVLIGGKDEMEDCRRIADLVGDGVVNMCGETEVLDIVPLARDAKYQVGNDTGTAHLAASSSRPMVVVCGPTDPYRVKPQGDNVVAIQADMPCLNCYCKQDCAHHSCMKAIQPSHVIAALNYKDGPVMIIPAQEAQQGLLDS